MDNEVMEFITVFSDYDYSPVIVYTKELGVIFEGDNIHNSNYEAFTEGFIEGIKNSKDKAPKIKKTSLYIGDLDDLKEQKEFLTLISKNTDFYQAFLDIFEF